MIEIPNTISESKLPQYSIYEAEGILNSTRFVRNCVMYFEWTGHFASLEQKAPKLICWPTVVSWRHACTLKWLSVKEEYIILCIYFRYLNKTNTILFSILSSAKSSKCYLSITTIGSAILLDDVIHFLRLNACW